jgi:glycosyltransferase involved in cell wall biosynthesis
MADDSLRITFLSWRDTSHPEGGGSEVYVEEVAKGLVARGHRVTVVCAAHGHAARAEIVDGVAMRRRGGRLTVYLHGLAFLLGREGRRQDLVIDVINGLPFAAPLVRRHGLVALVHHVHREQWRIIYPGLWGRVGWFLESRVTPVLYSHVPHVTVSQASRRDLVDLGLEADRVRVIHNGTPTPVRAVFSARSESPRLCVLSRLVPHKQIEHAVEVLATLAPTHPELTLDVIGDGWWADHVRHRIDELGVANRVTMHGHVDEAVKARLLDEAWLMLLPSVKEGWGIAVLEAASHHTPTLAYRSAGGVNESVRDGDTGVLVNDLAEMELATLELLGDHVRLTLMSSRAFEKAQNYRWEQTVSEFEQVLRESSRVTARRRVRIGWPGSCPEYRSGTRRDRSSREPRGWHR